MPRCPFLGVVRSSQAVHAHRIITTDDGRQRDSGHHRVERATRHHGADRRPAPRPLALQSGTGQERQRQRSRSAGASAQPSLPSSFNSHPWADRPGTYRGRETRFTVSIYSIDRPRKPKKPNKQWPFSLIRLQPGEPLFQRYVADFVVLFKRSKQPSPPSFPAFGSSPPRFRGEPSRMTVLRQHLATAQYLPTRQRRIRSFRTAPMPSSRSVTTLQLNVTHAPAETVFIVDVRFGVLAGFAATVLVLQILTVGVNVKSPPLLALKFRRKAGAQPRDGSKSAPSSRSK